MYVKDVVDRVRKAIDEVSQGGTDFDNMTEDEANLTAIIVDKIPYALQHVVENAPIEKLDSDMMKEFSAAQLEENVTRTADGVVKVKLPFELLRIIEARLSSWSHFPEPVPATSQVYLMQQDTYARGSYDRPVNILTHEGTQRVLEMYCQKDSNDKLIFLFINKPVIGSITTENMNDPVAVPTLLEASFIYQVAALTMVAFREDIADTLFNISQRYMDANTSLTVKQ